MWIDRGAFSACSGPAATPWTVAPRQVQLIRRPFIPGLPIWHCGVLFAWVGLPPIVYHLDMWRGILQDSIEGFASNRRWTPVGTLTGIPAVEAYQRLGDLLPELKPRSYNPFSWNCEHFARLIVSGESRSHQVQLACVGGVAAMGAFCLLKAD